MPERTSRTETVRAGAPIHVGPVTLLPIERVVVHSVADARRVWVTAAKEPAALVVRDATGTWAIGADAMPVSLQELRERVPGLDGLLASMGGAPTPGEHPVDAGKPPTRPP